MSVFRSVVEGDDGEIDAGYLGLYMVIVILLGAIPSAIVLAGIRMFLEPGHPLDLTGVAALVGAAGGAFGGAAAGVGVFRAGDKPRPGVTQTTTATQTKTEVKE